MVRLIVLIVLISLGLLESNAQSAKSDSLFAIGIDLYNAEKYKEAIPLFAESDKLDKVELDSTSNRRDYSAMWLASCYYQLGDSTTAETIDENNYRFTPVDRRLTIKSDSLSVMGVNLYQEGDISSALPLLLQSAEIEKSIVGDKHIWYANTIINCARLFAASGDIANALSYMKMAAEILKENLGISNKIRNRYAGILEEIAAIYTYSNDFTNALNYINMSLELYDDVINQEFIIDYINKLDSQSRIFNYMGNYENSLKLDLKCLEIYKVAQISCAEELYASILRRLADNYNKLGNVLKALETQKKTVEVFNNLYGEEHLYSMVQTNRLAYYNYSAGNYSEGIKLCMKALSICESLYGENAGNEDYASILSNLALNYSGIGDYNKAIIYTEKAYALETEHEKARLLVSLSGLYFMIGNYAKSIEVGERALTACESEYGKDHIYYSSLLNNLSLSLFLVKDFDKSSSYIKESLNIIENRFGKKHPDYANALANYAGFYDLEGKIEAAIRCEEEALQIVEKTMGKDKTQYSILASLLAKKYNDCGNISKCSHYILESSKSRKKYLVDMFKNLTSIERNDLWKSNEETFWCTYIHSASYKDRADSMVINGYNGILLGKGILLNTEKEITSLLMESGDQDIVDKYTDLISNKKMLEIEYSKPLDNRSQNIDSLEKRIDRIERYLVENVKVYGDITKNLNISWQDVQSKLKSTDVGVEFVSFPWTVDSTMYVAYVLKKGMDCPKLVPLFEEKQLKKDNRLYTTSSVSKLVWEPLAEYMEGIENVYFAPSGELYNIGIESLPHWNEDCLMSDKWNMYRLSSTRQLAIVKDKSSLKHASVYGGVKYDTKEDLLLADSKRYQSGERSFNYELFEIADSLNLRSGAAYLPATKIEAEEIDRTLEQKKIATTLKLDTLATEGAFKDLSGKKTNLLHIATHGFYWTEKEAQYSKNLDFLMLGDNQPKYVEDKALTRSGLLLAGANNALMGKKLPEGVDDGILTAKEISQLDLRGLDLVVLSACETGLGEIKGDGVFGLQRGFKKAGANSLLMSLWKVDDNATQLLMTRFYKNLTSGMSKFESLRQAQKYVREYEVEIEVKSDNRPSVSAHAREQAQQNVNKEKVFKKVKKYEDPKYWAAFILLDAID